VAGVVLTARATVGTPSAGEGPELNAITAAVLGDVTLRRPGQAGRGGRRVALLTLIQNVFTLLPCPQASTISCWPGGRHHVREEGR
jgi:ribose transport system permease protein